MDYITPVKQITFAPALTPIVELPPLRRNDVVIEATPSGLQIKARVVTCFWDDSMGANGEWSVYLKFYPMVRNDSGEWVQDMNNIRYTWTSPKVCTKVSE
jgi:hypothetical protein